MIATSELVQIGELIGVSLGAGMLVALSFSLCLYGAVHAGETRREGRHAAMAGWGVLATVAFAAFIVLCVLGIIFITRK